MKKWRSGFSLIELMVAISIFGGLAMILQNSSSILFKNNKALYKADHFQSIDTRVHQVVSRRLSCKETFLNKEFESDSIDELFHYRKVGPPFAILNVGEVFKGIRVSSMSWADSLDLGANRGRLVFRVVYEEGKMNSGVWVASKSYFSDYEVLVRYDSSASKLIIDCSNELSNSNLSSEICTSLGGLEEGDLDATNLYNRQDDAVTVKIPVCRFNAGSLESMSDSLNILVNSVSILEKRAQKSPEFPIPLLLSHSTCLDNCADLTVSYCSDEPILNMCGTVCGDLGTKATAECLGPNTCDLGCPIAANVCEGILMPLDSCGSSCDGGLGANTTDPLCASCGCPTPAELGEVCYNLPVFDLCGYINSSCVPTKPSVDPTWGDWGSCSSSCEKVQLCNYAEKQCSSVAGCDDGIGGLLSGRSESCIGGSCVCACDDPSNTCTGEAVPILTSDGSPPGITCLEVVGLLSCGSGTKLPVSADWTQDGDGNPIWSTCTASCTQSNSCNTALSNTCGVQVCINIDGTIAPSSRERYCIGGGCSCICANPLDICTGDPVPTTGGSCPFGVSSEELCGYGQKVCS